MKMFAVVWMLVVFQAFVSISQAWDSCKLESKQVLVCQDGYSTVGYCCDLENGFYTDCCYYSQVWALWYFWFCVAFFVMAAGAVAACCRRCLYRKRPSASASPNADNVTRSQIPSQPTTQPLPVAVDVPPSYQQLEAKGIQSQEVSVFKAPQVG